MSVNNEHEMLEPEQELKNVGLKATAPRMRILELFQKAQESGAVRLQISRNYKLFKLLHCHYSQF